MRLSVLLMVGLFLVACGENQSIKENPNRGFFYAVPGDDQYYVFRDLVNGLDEQIHRIYTVTDSKGQHIVMERYKGDGRLTEAYNYNVSDLSLDDHMVVDGNMTKTQAELLANTKFPGNDEEETYFASKVPGILDSTFFVFESKSKVADPKLITRKVLGKDREVMHVIENNRFNVINPYTKDQNEKTYVIHQYFAPGLGLVEWHDEDKLRHFVLESIVDRKEGLKLIGKSN